MSIGESKKYIKTYFYIDSAYNYDTGFPNDATENAFKQETQEMFKRLGWEVKVSRKHSGVCDTVAKGKQSLYLHPTEFVGIICPDEIPAIEDVIRQATTIRLRETRCFNEYKDMSDNEYAAYLDGRRDDMISAILSTYSTKRRNLYITGDCTKAIARKFAILRVSAQSQEEDMECDRVNQLVEELIADGRLVTAETRYGRGIRTATPDRKQKAVRQAKEQANLFDNECQSSAEEQTSDLAIQMGGMSL